MTRTVYGTFDGESLRLDEPISLPPNTRVRVTIETTDAEDAQPTSFLRVARTLNLQGPADWSAKLEDHLYGDVTGGSE